MATLSPILAAWSAQELLIVLIIVLILFGGAKLPGLAKGLGQSIKEFKKASRSDDEEEKVAEPKKNGSPPTTPGAN
jgi:sec-independent protein translocase protein TatA